MISQEMYLTFGHGEKKPTLEADLNRINVSHVFASKTSLTCPKGARARGTNWFTKSMASYRVSPEKIWQCDTTVG
jgi:hypothetical protein